MSSSEDPQQPAVEPSGATQTPGSSGTGNISNKASAKEIEKVKSDNEKFPIPEKLDKEQDKFKAEVKEIEKVKSDNEKFSTKEIEKVKSDNEKFPIPEKLDKEQDKFKAE